jgi:hypothetical protein
MGVWTWLWNQINKNTKTAATPVPADHFRDERQQLLEKELHRLVRDPSGVWQHQGGDPMIMEWYWTFRANGTGVYESFGTFGYPDSDPVPFEWVNTSEWQMQMRILWPDDEPEVCQVRYSVRVVDVSSWPALVMVSRSDTGDELPWFGVSTISIVAGSPIEWRGPVRDDPHPEPTEKCN